MLHDTNVAGLVCFQDWMDAIDRDKVAEGASNLAHFSSDVRSDLRRPLVNWDKQDYPWHCIHVGNCDTRFVAGTTALAATSFL